ncbi:MAG: C45 family autoproteolytic acyltransferase/hydrolase, partial [Acidimicrobiales bacterium]
MGRVTPLPEEIACLRATGSYRAVGRQIGEACAPSLRRAADVEGSLSPRHGRTLDETLEVAASCRQVTEQELPFLLEELDGAAEGAGVDKVLLFAAAVEELWEPRLPAAGRTEGRCTDVLVAADATSSGHLLVAHNNDLPARTEPDVVAIVREVSGDPAVFSIGIGPFVSAGWNSAGVSLTGNEVSPNDERPGIPRLLLARAQLRERDLAGAIATGI